MLLKLLGACCIVLACGLAGNFAAQKLQQRVRLLAELCQGFRLLSTQIAYGAVALAPACEETAHHLHGAATSFLEQVGRELRQTAGRSAEEIWCQAVADLALPAEDLTVLAQFGQNLGLCSCQDQLKRLELVECQLRENARLAREDACGYGRIWHSLGWGGGLMVALFFL